MLALLAVSGRTQGTYQSGDKVDGISVGELSIRTTEVADNFHVLTGIAPPIPGTGAKEGRHGGQIGVLSGPDGIFMVDAQYPPTDISQKVLAAIRQFSNDPIRFVVNTHSHVDHVGGNEVFANMGAIILSKRELQADLVNQDNYPVGGRPKVTYQGPVTFHMNGEEVELYPMPPAHTDGDTIIRFRNTDVLMMGDLFRASYADLLP